MEAVELAALFVACANARKTLEDLQNKIQQAVLEMEVPETQKIAGVTATYYKPSNETPDYEAHALAAMPEDFDLTPYSTTTTSVRWAEVCKVLNVSAPPGAPKPARVIVK